MAGITRWLTSNNTKVWDNCALSTQYSYVLSYDNGDAAPVGSRVHTRLRSFLLFRCR